MTTIDSLPPEALIRILELADEPGGLGTLCAASLVSLRWRDPAQSQLWRHLYIGSGKTAQRIVASPACGSFRTARR